uniref:C2H2-type domain-containing protein n=1 Tax=Oncorhynchus mykiss TaxID=8022 RepID=A0A8C7QTD0_ONCMY
MTKLQLLNAYLTERLTVVVREILDVVGDTVAEYREETARTKRENERLQTQSQVVLGKDGGLTGPNQGHTETVRVEEKPSPEEAIPKTEHNSDPEPKGIGNASSLAPSLFSSNAHCATTTEAAKAEMPVLRTEGKTSAPIDPIQGRIKMEPKEYMDISKLHNTPVHDQQTYETEPGPKDRVLPYDESNNFTPTDHQEGRPHRCTRCGESFSQAASLHLHLQYKKPYACDWCCKSFAQSADLRRHHRIHTGERPHRCSWCSKSFTQRGNLRRHLRLAYIHMLCYYTVSSKSIGTVTHLVVLSLYCSILDLK